MIPTLTPYAAYKDSGVEWLGQVPEHWEIRRLGSSVRGCVNGVWGSEPNGKDDLPCVRVADFDRSRLRVHLDKPTMRAISSSDRVRRLLKPGDLLLEKSGGGDLQPVGRVVLYDHPTVAVTSNFIARMPVENGYDSIYLTYLHAALYSIELNVRSIKQTTGIQNLDSRTYLSELVAFPPLPEQVAIVRFLDYIDRRIRRYIRAKQKLIKLLEEYKQALIHQAVTGSIDVRTGQPYPAYKPSGVEWLGQVPEHWEVLRLKYVARLRSGESITSERIEETGDYPVYGGNGIRGFTSSFTHEGEFVLIGRQGALCGNINYANGKFWASEHAVVVHPMRKCLNHLLGELLREMNLNQYSIAAAQPGLAVERIQNLAIPFPPIDEQEQIDQYIKNQVNAFDTAIATARREIELLREYRTRLIADVVTGKVDVREVAAQLPEEPSEEEAESIDADEIAEGEATDEEAGTETVEEEEVEP